ncbi:hypothetical protein I6I08_01190 [Actinomyces oris]|uniref:histidine kinase n=1 Tax=Actinomyces oris TaxID=544580 RepID=A0A508BQP0_9ACTO|nr:hypothetical protein I6I08_01190 [Actinomyces oris]TQD61875.1 hypothetical protein FK267_05640 [Actinomyces oris]
MQNSSFLSRLWIRHQRYLPHLRRATLISFIIPLILLDTYTYLTTRENIGPIFLGELFQILSFLPYVYAKDRRVGVATFSTALLTIFSVAGSRLAWAWILVYIIVADLTVARKFKLTLISLSTFFLAQLISGLPLLPVTVWTLFWGTLSASFGVLIRNTKDRLEEMQREAERSKEIAAELIQQLRRDIADSLHDDLAADLTRMLIISRSIRLPHGDDRDRVLDLQDRTQQALAHLRLLIHNLAVSQGPPKEEPTLQEIVDSSASTLAQREIVLDADLDGIQRIPTLHRSELGRLLVAFIRENTLNALKYNFPRDLVSLVVEQEQDTLFISFSSPWHDQKVPEEMHGGYGLWALQDRFENAGGSLSSNRIGASWTVLASLPWNDIATPTTTARSLMSPPDGAAYA